MHTVLGPELNAPASLRLYHLLENATAAWVERTKIHRHPLYAEDFLTVWNRNQLTAD